MQRSFSFRTFWPVARRTAAMVAACALVGLASPFPLTAQTEVRSTAISDALKDQAKTMGGVGAEATAEQVENSLAPTLCGFTGMFLRLASVAAVLFAFMALGRAATGRDPGGWRAGLLWMLLASFLLVLPAVWKTWFSFTKLGGFGVFLSKCGV